MLAAPARKSQLDSANEYASVLAVPAHKSHHTSVQAQTKCAAWRWPTLRSHSPLATGSAWTRFGHAPKPAALTAAHPDRALSRFALLSTPSRSDLVDFSLGGPRISGRILTVSILNLPEDCLVAHVRIGALAKIPLGTRPPAAAQRIRGSSSQEYTPRSNLAGRGAEGQLGPW